MSAGSDVLPISHRAPGTRAPAATTAAAPGCHTVRAPTTAAKPAATATLATSELRAGPPTRPVTSRPSRTTPVAEAQWDDEPPDEALRERKVLLGRRLALPVPSRRVQAPVRLERWRTLPSRRDCRRS